MSYWRQVKKIDAHIHILPEEVHRANPDSCDVWFYAKEEKFRILMDRYHIEGAVIMPLNDPWLMSMDFTAAAVHRNLREMKNRFPGKTFAFADIDIRNSTEKTLEELRRAIDLCGLDGIKIHANNSGVPLDAPYNREIFAYAQKRKIPVAIHGYPNSEEDLCAVNRICNIMKEFPGLTVIVSHMGGFQWERLVELPVYVDISAILPGYVRAYGIQETNRILRLFGPDRLLFATDYPDSRFLEPEEIYEQYFDLLDQMDFTEAEIDKIAYHTIMKILSQ